MNVLVCDDHPIVAAAISSTIEGMFGARVHVTHSFAGAREVIRTEPALALCLFDIHVPGEDARAHLAEFRQLLPHVPILAFSGSEADDDLRMVLELGLHGFLSKSAPPEVVEAAIRLVLAGGRYLPERVAELIVGHPNPAQPPPGPVPAPAPAGTSRVHFTPRQRLVLGLLADGHSNKAIAAELGISPATVKAHVAQIIGVLGAVNRTQAVARARELDLL